MPIHRLAGIVIVCLALFAFGISVPAKAEPDTVCECGGAGLH